MPNSTLKENLQKKNRKETLKNVSNNKKTKIKLKMLAVTVILRHSVVCNRLQPIYIKKQKL